MLCSTWSLLLLSLSLPTFFRLPAASVLPQFIPPLSLISHGHTETSSGRRRRRIVSGLFKDPKIPTTFNGCFGHSSCFGQRNALHRIIVDQQFILGIS